MIEPSRGDLAALAEKYGELAEMRRRELEGHPPREDAHYRELARRFPGALKELDQLELAELDRRREALDGAARTGEVAPWMRLVHAYHGFLRGAREVKRALGREPPALGDLAALASRAAGFEITAGDVEELLLPGKCRIVPAAVTFVAARAGATPAEVRAALAIRAPRA